MGGIGPVPPSSGAHFSSNNKGNSDDQLRDALQQLENLLAQLQQAMQSGDTVKINELASQIEEKEAELKNLTPDLSPLLRNAMEIFNDTFPSASQLTSSTIAVQSLKDQVSWIINGIIDSK